MADELQRSEYLRALLNQQKGTIANGSSLVNPSIQQAAEIDTSFAGQTGMAQPQEVSNKKYNPAEAIFGFVDEIAAKFGAGFVGAWEGILDLGATGIGWLGDATGLYDGSFATDWAKQDLGTAASEWVKTYANFTPWAIVSNITNGNYGNSEYWRGAVESGKDLFGSALFASNQIGNMREQADQHYGMRDDLTTGVGQFVGNTAYTIGFMLPSILTAGGAGSATAASVTAKNTAAGITRGVNGLGALAGAKAAGITSTLMFGATAGGKASEQALNDGANASGAFAYGLASGGAEAASEHLVGKGLSLIGAGTGKIFGVISDGATKQVVKTTSREFVTQLLKTANEEGMEEVSTALVDPLLKSIYKGSEALEEYKDLPKFLFGIGGDFQESVTGQYIAGAVTSGIMGGANIIQQNKQSQAQFGKYGVKVAQQYEESAIALHNMLEYKEGSSQYNKWQRKYFEAIGKMNEAWNSAQSTIDKKQLSNLRKFILNPNEFVDSTDAIKAKIDSLSDINKEATKAVFSDIAEAARSGYRLEFSDNLKQNALVNKTKRIITLNSKLANEYGSLIGHELAVHGVVSQIGPKGIRAFYNQIKETGWFKSREKDLIREYQTKDSKYKELKTQEAKDAYYQEEVLANFFQEYVSGTKGSNISQLQFVKSMFKKRGLVKKVLDFFNRIKTKEPSIISNIKDITEFVIKSSDEATFKRLVRKLKRGVSYEKLSLEEKQAFEMYKNVFDDMKPSEEMVMASKDLSNVDSQGNELTEAQAKFFKGNDFVNKRGELLVLYHGTPQKAFTKFETRFNDGIFLTDNKEVADVYGTPITDEEYARSLGYGNVFELYAKSTNTFEVDVSGDEYNDIIEPLTIGKSKWAKDVSKYDLSSTDNLAYYAKKHGFSGLIIRNVLDDTGIVHDEYVVFNSNQVKNVDNKNPTENEDIRYSKDLDENLTTAELVDKYKQYFDEILVEKYSSIETSKEKTKNEFGIEASELVKKLYDISENFQSQKLTKADIKTVENFLDFYEIELLHNKFSSGKWEFKSGDDIYYFLNLETGEVVNSDSFLVDFVGSYERFINESIARDSILSTVKYIKKYEKVLTALNDYDAIAKMSDAKLDKLYKAATKVGIQLDIYDNLGRPVNTWLANFMKESRATVGEVRNGTPVTAYHSSDAFGFTVFSEAFNDKYKGRPQHGFYFTDNKYVAHSYIDSEYALTVKQEYQEVIKNSLGTDDAETIDDELVFAAEYMFDSADFNRIDVEFVNTFLNFMFKEKEGKWELRKNEELNESYFKNGDTKVDTEKMFELKFNFFKKYFNVQDNAKDKKTYEVYLNLKNPLIIDCEKAYWNEIPNPLVERSSQEAVANYIREIIEEDDYWEDRWYYTTINKQTCHHFAGLKTFDDIPSKGKYKNGGAAFIAALDKISKYQEVQDYLKAEQEIRKAKEAGNKNKEKEAVQKARDIFKKHKTQIRAYFKMLYTYFEAVEWVQNNEYAKRPLESTRKISSDAYNHGYDGIIFKNVYDMGGYEDHHALSTVYVVFNSNQIKRIDNEKPTNSDDIRYSKDLDENGVKKNLKANSVKGSYTVGDNKKKITVKLLKDGTFEIVDGETILTEATVGGETFVRDSINYEVPITEMDENDNPKVVRKEKRTRTIYGKEGGETIKFDSPDNVKRYLDDIGAVKIERKFNNDNTEKQPKERKIEAEFLENVPKQAELDKADRDKSKYISLDKPVYINENGRVYRLKAEKVQTKLYNVEVKDKKTGKVEARTSITPKEYRELKKNKDVEIVKTSLAGKDRYKYTYRGETREVSASELRNFINSYTRASNTRADVIEAKKYPSNVFATNNNGKTIIEYKIKALANGKYEVIRENANGELTKKTMSYSQISKELSKYKKVSFDGKDSLLSKPAKKEPKKVSKPKKTVEERATKRIQKTVDKLEVQKVEQAKPVDVETAINKAKKEIKRVSFKSVESTKEIVDKSIDYLKDVLGEGYKVRVPISMQDFNVRAISEINAVQDTELEAKRLTNLMLDIQVETAKGEYVGELGSLLTDNQIKDFEKAAKGIIESAPSEKARSSSARLVQVALEKMKAIAQDASTGKGRVRVLVREIDRARKRINVLSEIAKNQDLASGFDKLVEPFAEIHGNDKGFSAKELVNRVKAALDWYREDNNELQNSGFPYNDVIRSAYEDVYETLGYGVEKENGVVYKTLSAESMQKIIDAIRLVKKTINKAIVNQTNVVRPSSQQTVNAIARNKNGKSKNFFSRLLRKYKRGFAPSYVLVEDIFGGDSELTKLLVYDLQEGINKQTGYVGIYHDEINKKLKELKIKKTFDTKRVKINDIEMSVDQAMGLYISLKVEANYNAIEKDGVAIYDNKYNRMVDLAGNGQAEALKASVDSALPENYKQFADWLLSTMNSSVKAEYIEWFKEYFGELATTNEIGTLKDNSYWTLKRKYLKMDNITKAVSNPDALFSNAKHRTKGGGNQVLITGALSTFDAYINKLGRELYVKNIYEDAVQIMNVKNIDGKSVMDVLSENVDSTQDNEAIKEFLADVLGANTRKVNLLDKMVSAFSVAKLSLNIGSMGKQFASIFTSNIPIPKTIKAMIARAFDTDAQAELKKLYDGVKNEDGSWEIEPLYGLRYREATKGVLRANADTLANTSEKIAQAGMIGISKIDLFTVNTGVYALMVIGQNEYNYKIGSKENIEFVKQHFSEFQLSQIGNSPLSKNYISRSVDGVVRYLFGFLQGANRAAIGSQFHKWGLWSRNKNRNKAEIQDQLKLAKKAFEEAKAKYDANPENEEIRNNYITASAKVKDFENILRDYNSFEVAGGRRIRANMVSGLIAQGIFIALINTLMKRIKGRKDWDEWDIMEEGLALLKSMGLDWIPFVNFVSNIVQGYEVDIPAINLFNQISEIFSSWKNGGSVTTMIKQIALLAGDMTGIPFQTIYQYIYGTIKMFDPSIAYEMRSVLYGASIQSATKTLKSYSDRGNVGKTTSMVSLIMEKYKTGSSTDEINKELANLYIAGYSALPKTAMTQYTDDSGDVVKLTKEQITAFSNLYSQSTKDVAQLLKMSDYRNLTSEEKAKAIKKIYDTYYAAAKAKVTGSAVSNKLANLVMLSNGSVNISKFVFALQKISTITETSSKTRKELVLEYINRLTGFSKAEKTMLMYLAGYSVSGASETLLINTLTSYGVSRSTAMSMI